MSRRAKKINIRKVVLYTRVSTKEQADQGVSLEEQLARLHRFCNYRGYEVVGHFKDDATGINFDRPGFQQMLQLARSRRKKFDAVVFAKWDRFTRARADLFWTMTYWFLDRDFELIAEDRPSLDPRTDVGAFNLMIESWSSNREVLVNSDRTWRNMQLCRQQGRWVGRPPLGYIATKDYEGKFGIKPGPKANVVKKVFQMIADGESQAEVLRQLKPRGLSVETTRLARLLRDVTYIGYIRRGENGCFEEEDDPDELFKGRHKAIISRKLFDAVQRILSGERGRQGRWRHQPHEEIPLRGHLMCPECGRRLTGSGSPGKSGKKYYYYHCQPPCKVRFPAQRVNDSFAEHFGRLAVPDPILELFEEVLTDVFRRRNGSVQDDRKRLQKELTKLKEQQSDLDARYHLDGKMDAETYDRLKHRIESKIEQKQSEFGVSSEDLSNTLKMVRSGLRLLVDIPGYFEECSMEAKHRILGILYPKGVTYDGQSYRTPSAHPAVQILSMNISDLQNPDTKKAGENPAEMQMASPRGFEPLLPK